MRRNSIFIAHVTEAIDSPLGGGRGRRSGLPRVYPQTQRDDLRLPFHLTCTKQTHPDRLRQNWRAWYAEGRRAKKRSAPGRITPTLSPASSGADGSRAAHGRSGSGWH